MKIFIYIFYIHLIYHIVNFYIFIYTKFKCTNFTHDIKKHTKYSICIMIFEIQGKSSYNRINTIYKNMI